MRTTCTCLWLALALGAPAAADDPLAEITHTIEGRARRASSGLFDPESNHDAYHIAAGQTTVLTTLEGPGEIRRMWFTIAGRDRRYPRTLVLRIYWDGAAVPAVETPVGDFFAAGNGMRANVNSLPIQVTSYGRSLNCYWRMPFRREARIELTNEGPSALTVYWQFDWMQVPRVAPDMLYFHARYRQEFPAKPFSPYVIFEGRGCGHYVGTVFSTQCSYGSWFGESDDRFYIDGEREPSIVGTGCEDYFNDAWNFREFTNDNTGVTIKEPNGEDCRFTAYRWHVRAPITFCESLKVEIERRSFAQVTDPKSGSSVTHDFKYRPDFCSSVAFWYQQTIAEPFDRFPAAAERVNREIFLDTSELADEIRCSPGTSANRRSNRVCNLKQCLQVDNPRVGGWFEIPCEVAEEGKYSISVFQCLYRTGGIWKVTLQGPGSELLLAPAMDFFDPYLAWRENRPENYLYGTWQESKVGIHLLSPGQYIFRFECVGSHPLATASDADRPGLNCRLDGISLRRFPWDDLSGLMQQYLVAEQQREASLVAQAKQIDAQLSAAIEAFRHDTHEYPQTLDDLLRRPQRMTAQTGHWPYVADLPADPWGQDYRYACPGVFNAGTFDVYSVHGNSRDPAVWIGNWPDPFHIVGACEGEDLAVHAASEAVTIVKQTVTTASPPPLSHGQLLLVRFQRPGDWIELRLPRSVKPGRYEVRLRLVTSWDYAIVGAAFSGTSYAQGIDTYAPHIGLKSVNLGLLDTRVTDHVLRLQALDHNPASKGCFAGIDAVELIPTEAGETE